jgi:hypothetical protein
MSAILCLFPAYIVNISCDMIINYNIIIFLFNKIYAKVITYAIISVFADAKLLLCFVKAEKNMHEIGTVFFCFFQFFEENIIDLKIRS